MEDFSDDKLEHFCKCQSHRTRKYWIVNFTIHITLLIISTSLLNRLSHSKVSWNLPIESDTIGNSKELFGTFSCK